ncbi:MAG: hypothetical protein LJE68_12880 [Rhodobacter sp.]|nr:hypothetical protein [Rhodobacter sp.]
MRRQAWQLYVVLGLSGLGVVLTLIDVVPDMNRQFWDLAVYSGAAAVAGAGGDAYAETYSGLRFVYPPLVLAAFSALGAALTPLLLTCYAALTVLFVTMVPPSLRLSVFLIFGVMLGFDYLSRAAFTGNLTIFLHLAVVLLWLRPDLRLQPVILISVIEIAALIKPYFAAYFALWLFRDARLSRDTAHAGLALALVIAIWAAQALFMPDQFAAFIKALTDQLGLAGTRQDLGVGLFRVAIWLKATKATGMAVHLAVWAALATVWFALLRPRLKARNTLSAQTLLSVAPLILCLILNPRLKVYDIAMLCLLGIQAGYLWSQARPGQRLSPLLTLCIAFAAIASLDFFTRNDDTINALQYGMVIVVLLAGFAMSAWIVAARPDARLRPSSAPDAQPARPDGAGMRPRGPGAN